MATFLLPLLVLGAAAADWPQWRGAARDGISRETLLLREWPEGGPRELWSVEGLGQGFSTMAVVGDLLWKHAHKNRYALHATTPIYHGGRVLISSGYGQGTEMLEMSRNGQDVRVVWTAKELDNHHGGVILHEGRLYIRHGDVLMAFDISGR